MEHFLRRPVENKVVNKKKIEVHYTVLPGICSLHQAISCIIRIFSLRTRIKYYVESNATIIQHDENYFTVPNIHVMSLWERGPQKLSPLFLTRFVTNCLQKYVGLLKEEAAPSMI